MPGHAEVPDLRLMTRSKRQNGAELVLSEGKSRRNDVHLVTAVAARLVWLYPGPVSHLEDRVTAGLDGIRRRPHDRLRDRAHCEIHHQPDVRSGSHRAETGEVSRIVDLAN